ncbi:hypothetical protein [Pseudohaliea sp.]|uniref:hypothetical protein n=1 Tax=Pseudohaliea sp. TaxID=2740289 RepID=UPI0032ECF46A
MSLFEFIMIMIAIIIGLGIAELLAGVSSLLRHRAKAKTYWVHMLLTAVVFLALLQQFWEAWSLREVSEWTFIALLQVLGAPVCLYLCARLLLPENLEGEDIEGYYYSEMRPIWLLLFIGVCLSTTLRPIVFDGKLLAADNLQSLIILVALPLLWASSNRVLHSFCVSLALLLVLGDIVIFAGDIAN